MTHIHFSKSSPICSLVCPKLLHLQSSFRWTKLRFCSLKSVWWYRVHYTGGLTEATAPAEFVSVTKALVLATKPSVVVLSLGLASVWSVVCWPSSLHWEQWFTTACAEVISVTKPLVLVAEPIGVVPSLGWASAWSVVCRRSSRHWEWFTRMVQLVWNICD